MKKVLYILFLISFASVIMAAPIPVEVAVNGDFETVDPCDPLMPQYWWTSSEPYGIGWSSYESNPGAYGGTPHSGSKYLRVGVYGHEERNSWAHTWFGAKAGDVFEVSAYMRNDPEPGFEDGSALFSIEYKDAFNNILRYDTIRVYGGLNHEYWEKYAITFDPAPLYTSYVVCFWKTEGRSILNIDDASVLVVKSARAANPNPVIGEDLDMNNLPALTWELPEPWDQGDTITCDVYISENEDMSSATQLVNNQSVSQVALPGSIVADKVYYWQVTCHDPNGVGEGAQSTVGFLWNFDTHNYAPVVDAGPSRWCELSGSVSLDGTVTDADPTTVLWTVDSKPGGSTVTFGDDTAVDTTAGFSAVGTYILKLTATDSGALDSNDMTTVYVEANGYTGLVAHWKLDEASGSTAADSSGNSHNGTLVGTNLVWHSAGGYVDGALEFNDANEYVDCGGDAPNSWADISDFITVAAWVKVDQFDKAWQAIVAKGDDSWRLHRNDDTNSINFTCNGIGYVVTGDIDDDKWHHVVGVYDGDRISIYLDGQLAQSKDRDNANRVIDDSDYAVRIGSNAQYPVGREWNGLIDDVRIYEVDLSSSEVVDLFYSTGGNNCPSNLEGDIDGNCHVNLLDFSRMAGNWLNCNEIGNPDCTW